MTRYEKRAIRDLVEYVILAIVFLACFGFVFYLEFHDEPEEHIEPEVVEQKVVAEPAPIKATALVPLEAPVERVEPPAEPEPVATEYAAFPEEEALVSLGEFKITHYCPCPKCCGKSESDPWYGITSTGTKATEGRTIAVDPKVIPYGTDVLLRYADGTEAIFTAEDCGGAIKSKRIDVFMDSHQAALVEGVKYAEVFLVKE